MKVINLSSTSDETFIELVKKESGQDPADCYQCGNCTAGCPYTEFFDYPVSMVMRLIQAGQKDTVLDSKAIWLCATCETCTTRCPCQIDVAHIMDTLRNIAYREGRYTEKDVKVFYESFLTSLKNNGRIYELGILMGYKTKTFHFLGDADLGPSVLAKGLIHFQPNKIAGREEVQRIFKRFAEKRDNQKREKHG